MNVYARSEGWSVRVYLGGTALLVEEPGAIHSRGDRTLANSVWNVYVLGFRVVLRLFIVGGETGKVESCARSGSVGNVGGGGTNAAGAKTSEEGSTVVLLRYGHLEGIGRESEGLSRKVHETEGIAREVDSNGEGRLNGGEWDEETKGEGVERGWKVLTLDESKDPSLIICRSEGIFGIINS